MSKSTNKQQSQHLLSLMEANPDIARGFFKGGKEILGRFWSKAEAELNAMGPPVKCIAEWKKVWADQKKYVRQKASQNLRDKKSTGGGPCKEQKFSPTEEAIYNLIGMKASVEGVPVKPIGLSPPHKAVPIPPISDFVSLDDLPDILEDSNENKGTTPLNFSKISVATRVKTPICQDMDEQKCSTKSSINALEAELEIQKELLATVKEAVANQKEQELTARKIYRSLDRLSDQNRKHFLAMEAMKREEIQEMRRHNAFMEKLRTNNN